MGPNRDEYPYPTPDELAAYEEPLPDYQFGQAEPILPDYGGYPYPHVEPVQSPLDRIALALYGNVPDVPTQRYEGSPSGAAAGFLTGLARGFSGVRAKRISEREKLNQVLAQKAHDENMANLAATRAAEAERAMIRRENRAETRIQQREQSTYERDNPVLTQEMIDATPKGSVIRQLKPGERISRTRYEEARLREPRSTENEPLVQIQGPKGPVWVRRSDAVGKPAPGGTNKPPTPVQQAAHAFYNRANNAVNDVMSAAKGQKSLEDRIAALSTKEQFAMRAPNFMQSPDIQAYNQAKKVFAGALLRKESGAAINAQEYRDIDQSFFVQPGDKSSTIEQKRRARKIAIEGLRLQAGPSSPDISTLTEEQKDAIYQEVTGGQ